MVYGSDFYIKGFSSILIGRFFLPPDSHFKFFLQNRCSSFGNGRGSSKIEYPCKGRAPRQISFALVQKKKSILDVIEFDNRFVKNLNTGS